MRFRSKQHQIWCKIIEVPLGQNPETPKNWSRTRQAILHAAFTTIILLPLAAVLLAIMPGEAHFTNPNWIVFEARVAGPPKERARDDHFDLKLNYVRDGAPRHIWLFLPRNPLNPKGCLFQPANPTETPDPRDVCGTLAPGKTVWLVGVDVENKLQPIAVNNPVTGLPIIPRQMFVNSITSRRISTFMVTILITLTLIGIYIHAARQIWLDRKAKQARQESSEQVP